MRKELLHSYAVVLVGGKGKRLRPLSTDRRPKAFISITKDKKTMFSATLGRVGKLLPADHIVVVANKAHVNLVRKDFAGAGRNNIILEPLSRNTAPAIGLAAKLLLARDKDAIMVVLPTDHYIPEGKKQIAVFRKVIRFVHSHPDAIVTIGLEPKYPAIQYGYIQAAKSKAIIKVKSFKEKPDLSTARKYAASGNYLWNTGTFIFTARAILSALKMHAPEIATLLERGNAGAIYKQMPNISVDYAVMERAKNIFCVRALYEWSDVGSFDELKKVLVRESRRFVEKNGKIIKIL